METGSPSVGAPSTQSAIPAAAGVLISAIVAVAAGVLLIVAGWLTIAADNLRWGEACAENWDDHACEVVQDHRYDYIARLEQPPPTGNMLPDDPWVPIPGTAQLAGIGMLVLALALAMTFATIRSAVWIKCGQALVVISVVVVGATSLATESLGRPVAGFTAVVIAAFAVWALLGPLVMVFSGLEAVTDRRGRGPLPPRAWVVWTVTLAAGTPLLNYVLAKLLSMGYLAYDSTPWEEAPKGAMYVLAGATMLAGVAWNAVRRARRSTA